MNDDTTVKVRKTDIPLIAKVQEKIVRENPGVDPTSVTRGEAVRRALLAYLGETG